METHRMCHPHRPRRPRAAVRRPWWAVVIPCLLAFWLTVPAASAEAGAAEVEFVDVLFTPTPLPGTDVSLVYGFARTRERDEEMGSIHRHEHEVSLGLSYQIAEWVGIGVGIPYSITDVRTPDPATGDPIEPDTRKLGDTAQGARRPTDHSEGRRHEPQHVSHRVRDRQRQPARATRGRS